MSWDCKYHVVFLSKNQKKKIFEVLRKHLGGIFRELATYKSDRSIGRAFVPDHVHICLSITPMYAVSNVVGYLKDKSAFTIARKYGGRAMNFT
jgi:putative transposase